MSDEKTKDRITEEVDGRLEDFFSDDWSDSPSTEQEVDLAVSEEPAPPPPPPARPSAPASAPVADAADNLGLKDLKVLVLSLDWEITDSIMENMESEAVSLKKRLASDPVLVTYLSLLELLGRYVRVKKASAHPEAVNLIRDIYDSLESVMGDPQMAASEKKRAVLGMVERFNRIKKQISTAGPVPAAPVATAEVVEAQPVPVEEAVVLEAQPVEVEEVVLEATPVAPAQVLAAPLPSADLDALRQQVASLRGLVENEIADLKKQVAEVLSLLRESLGKAPAPIAEALPVAELAPAAPEEAVAPEAELLPPDAEEPLAAAIVEETPVMAAAAVMGEMVEEALDAPLAAEDDLGLLDVAEVEGGAPDDDLSLSLSQAVEEKIPEDEPLTDEKPIDLPGVADLEDEDDLAGELGLSLEEDDSGLGGLEPLDEKDVE